MKTLLKIIGLSLLTSLLSLFIFNEYYISNNIESTKTVLDSLQKKDSLLMNRIIESEEAVDYYLSRAKNQDKKIDSIQNELNRKYEGISFIDTLNSIYTKDSTSTNKIRQ